MLNKEDTLAQDKDMIFKELKAHGGSLPTIDLYTQTIDRLSKGLAEERFKHAIIDLIDENRMQRCALAKNYTKDGAAWGKIHQLSIYAVDGYSIVEENPDGVHTRHAERVS